MVSKSSYSQWSCAKRCMKEKSLNSWEATGRKDGLNQSFPFYYSSEDGSRGKVKSPTITWKITQYKAQGCGMCLHSKAHHLTQPCCWHNSAIKLKDHLRVLETETKEFYAQTKPKWLRQICRLKWKWIHCSDYLCYFVLSFTFKEICCVSKQSFSFLVKTPDASDPPLTGEVKLCVSHRVNLFTLPMARVGFIRLISVVAERSWNFFWCHMSFAFFQSRG